MDERISIKVDRYFDGIRALFRNAKLTIVIRDLDSVETKILTNDDLSEVIARLKKE